ncbi:hypothetical protein ACLOJK_011879, partial [Asimina triloba]
MGIWELLPLMEVDQRQTELLVWGFHSPMTEMGMTVNAAVGWEDRFLGLSLPELMEKMPMRWVAVKPDRHSLLVAELLDDLDSPTGASPMMVLTIDGEDTLLLPERRGYNRRWLELAGSGRGGCRHYFAGLRSRERRSPEGPWTTAMTAFPGGDDRAP